MRLGRIVLAAGVTVLVIEVALLVTTAGHHHHSAGHPTVTASMPATKTPTPRRSPSPALTAHTPETVVPSGTPAQEQADQQLTQSTLPDLNQIEATPTPAPALTGWPTLAVANTPDVWATEFVAGLLDINYRTQSRTALASWLQAESAPDLMTGVPAAVAPKVLYLSLFEPALAQSGGTPIPDADQWAALAKADTSQRVSDLLVQTDPQWTQLVATGWQPTDVRMTIEDVSGLLATTTGRTTTTEHFSVQVTTGSAAWHAGYGTVAVDAWTVTT